MQDFLGNVKNPGLQALCFENITLATLKNSLEEMDGLKDSKQLQKSWGEDDDYDNDSMGCRRGEVDCE